MRNFVPRFILEQFAGGQYTGQFPAGVLFVDISGFTALTETLFQHRTDGAEVLGETMATIFRPLVQETATYNGIIPLFAGDAFTAIFPVKNNDTTQAILQAWHTATAIQHYLTANGQTRIFPTRHGDFAIGVRIGLGMGLVHWGIPGQEGHHTFYFAGPAIEQAAQAQACAQTGQIVAAHNLIHRLPASATPIPGTHFCHVQPTGPRPAPTTPANPLPAATRTEQQPFIPAAVLDFAGGAEFRTICPVFISGRTFPTQELLHQFIADLLTLTQTYGGTFSQVEFADKGLVIVLWFGAPISHENSVARAAACLLALQANPAYAGLWRAGFTYGLVWAGIRGGSARCEYGAIGNVVNSAARIAFHCPWGEIWLAEDAAQEIQDSFSLAPLGQFQLRGQQATTPLYRLEASGTALNLMFRGAMVGRQSALRQVLDALQPIFQPGRNAGLVYIDGPAGIGKSRLLYQIQQQLPAHARWFYCPSDDILRQPLNPFRSGLQNHFGLQPDQSSRQNQQQFATQLHHLLAQLHASHDPQAASLHAELHRTQSFLAALLGFPTPNSLYERLSPKLRAENTHIALITFFQAQALLHPTIICLEDAHWLDAESRTLATNLLQQLADYPAALLLASRYHLDGTPHRLASSAPATTIPLGSLPHPSIRHIAEQIAQHPLTDEVIGFLHKRSDGNPFFAEQLLLYLLEQKQLVPQMQGQQLVYTLGQPPAGELPPALHTLLITRLDRLPAPVKQVVHTAAILGQSFAVPVLAAMLEDDPLLPEKLSLATSQQVWQMLDDLRYLFRHALLRDAAYQMQMQAQRRKLHRQAAETLIRLHQANTTPPPYRQIAYHYEMAYQLGDYELALPASTALFQAAQDSAARYENNPALDYLTRALALLPAGARQQRYDILMVRQKLYELLGEREQQQSDLHTLLPLAKTLGRPQQIAAALAHADYLLELEDKRPVLQTLQQALGWAQALPDKTSMVRILVLWVLALRRQSNDTAAQVRLEQAYALVAEMDDPDLLAHVLWTQGALAFDRQDWATARECYARCRTIYQEMGNLRREAVALNSLGAVMASAGELAIAQRYFEMSLVMVEQIGARHTMGVLLNNLGRLAMDLAQWAGAQSYFKRSLAISQAIGDLYGATMTRNNIARLAYQLGNLDEAQVASETALTTALASQNKREVYEAARLLGRVHLARQQPALAAPYLAQALAIARALDLAVWEAGALNELGLMALSQGDLPAGEAYYQQAAHLWRELQEPDRLAETTAGLAQIALQRGDPAAAQAYSRAVLAHLAQNPTLDNAYRPLWVYLTLYKVLAALQNAQAKSLLAQANARLQAQAAALGNPAWQDAFLQNFPWHREIMTLAGSQTPQNGHT
ncbi:MAG: tetratricopeptide repeat protein [Ardenticatenaceae bacterium]|nr:tetratricopeptide repeat protein [Ardenticatenaceae bacterium]